MKSPIIGIAGRAGHGKDTIGAILASYGYERKAFADKVRELALAIDPLVCRDNVFMRLSTCVSVYGWDESKRHADIRRLLQNIGEGTRQTLDSWIWVDALFATLDTRFNCYAITDVRYPNEIVAIHSRGGVVWYVDRPDYDNGTDDHVSEQLDPALCDLVIENDGTVEDLREKVEMLLCHTN